jgi:AraC-like DNA-binding protein
VYPLLERLVEEGRNHGPGAREMAEALLRQIIVLLMRMYRMETGPAPVRLGAPMLTRAGLMPIVEDAFFYRHRTLTLSDLASLLNLSQRQTQRLLRENFGKTFSQKLTDARMAAASQLLAGTDLSVTEIAERSGYSSIEHFSAAFHRQMGCSPREYRKTQRS